MNKNKNLSELSSSSPSLKNTQQAELSQAPWKIFDTTLRDGSQSENISFTLADKVTIFRLLDDFGIDYVEGGWPGSNPKDMEFFVRMQSITKKHAKVTAFGSTRKADKTAEQDVNLRQIIETEADAACIFGKAWDFQVKKALKIDLAKNLDMIHESLVHLKKYFAEVIFDLEHFFDGFKANPDYAFQVIEAATSAKCDYLVFCDTNGGTMPWEVRSILQQYLLKFSTPFGIHAHNDCELAVSNSLEAIRLGAQMVQGTVNGLGERCGNANLISILANSQLKMGASVVSAENLRKLTSLSNEVAEIANLQNLDRQAFTGNSAFTHKGGVHVSAVMKDAQTYEHIDPSLVGNQRKVLISELSGLSNFTFKLQAMGLAHLTKHEKFKQVLRKLKELELQGYVFEGADASFELLMLKELGLKPQYFTLVGYRVIDEKRSLNEEPISEATVKFFVGKHKAQLAVAEGHGPVDALSNALKNGLMQYFPAVESLKLIDYKVRILDSKSGTAAKTRVLISSQDTRHSWATVGLSWDIINASLNSLIDSFDYSLLKAHHPVPKV